MQGFSGKDCYKFMRIPSLLQNIIVGKRQRQRFLSEYPIIYHGFVGLGAVSFVLFYKYLFAILYVYTFWQDTFYPLS